MITTSSRASGIVSLRFSDDAALDAIEPRGSWRTPESRLMLAVLQDALLTLHSGLRPVGPVDYQEFRDVVEWIRSRESDWPFSFESICESLQMNAESIRAEFTELKRKAAMQPEALGSLRILRSRT